MERDCNTQEPRTSSHGFPFTVNQSRVIAKGVRLTRLPDGIELYFPPLRSPGAALSLGFFGVACLIPGLFAAAAVAPLSGSGAAGMLAIWLMSIFILPFVAFGVLFLGVAGYRLVNSLTVVVTGSHVRTLRRILGVPVRKEGVGQTDIAALDAVASARDGWLGEDVPFYDLVVRTRTGAAAPGAAPRGDGSVKVAESLRGEDLMERVRAEIAAAARLRQAA
jgi:hypothetical protein